MNSTKKNSEFGGVKKKLTAAIAMLLVATIMMVSSTYAWFTLSTAPEVTGITTSVGANGNLEMALLPTSGATADIPASAVGDSNKTAKERNLTWGNLVDLRDDSYGLGKISLNPARLNMAGTDTTKISTTSILNTANYGNDGRVIDISGTTVTGGTYNPTEQKFGYTAGNMVYGVRAIGSDGQMTKQQAGLVAAKGNYSDDLNSARSGISTVLSTNANDLGGAIVALGTGKGNFTEAHKKAISNLVTASETALSNIDKAYVEVFKAYLASAVEDTATYETLVSAITSTTTISSLASHEKWASAPETLKTAVTALATQQQAVSEAKALVTKTGATDQDYKDALKKLVDYDKVTLNGFAVKEPENPVEGTQYAILRDNSINSDFSASVIGHGVTVAMPNGSGVFAYIGSVAGNYSASAQVHIEGVATVPATLTTTATPDTTVKDELNALKAAKASGGDTYITDSFGYVLDFAFRTNAAGSSLQLATDGLQRIYNGTDNASQNADTMGSGSTMTFKAADGVSLSAQQITKLMEAIRVVFINPEDGTIYGVATLDNISVDANDTDALTGKLSLKKATYDKDGKLTIGTWEEADKTAGTNLKLVDLPQNTATKVSAVVYLDGDLVDNTMVANASKSITGSMNLQFTSSETLVPMNYSPLKNGTGTAEP